MKSPSWQEREASSVGLSGTLFKLYFTGFALIQACTEAVGTVGPRKPL